MNKIELSQKQLRLLGALFTRSHIAGRRRTYREGYLMAELDGVTLSERDIWENYRPLREAGLIQTGQVNQHLVLKLTENGDVFCQTVIYPNLTRYKPIGQEGRSPEMHTVGVSSLEFARGKSIDQISEILGHETTLLKELSSFSKSEGLLDEGDREEIRKMIQKAEFLIDQARLSNSDSMQVSAYLKVIMALVDAPSSPKKDISHYLGLVADILGVGTTVGPWFLAAVIYLTSRS